MVREVEAERAAIESGPLASASSTARAEGPMGRAIFIVVREWLRI